jgi:hypothetical protein
MTRPAARLSPVRREMDECIESPPAMDARGEPDLSQMHYPASLTVNPAIEKGFNL